MGVEQQRGVRARERRPPPDIGVAFGVVWLIITVLIAFQDGPGLAAGFLVVPYIVIAAHEFGHWRAAWLVRLPTSGAVVRIGAGPSIGLGSRAVRLGLLPGTGRVELPLAACGRIRRIAFLLGGAVGNIVFAFALAAVAAEMTNTPALIGVVALASLATAIVNLIPVGLRGFGGTDGCEILRTLFGR